MNKLLLILCLSSSVQAQTYIFVSHSLSDESLKSYFKEAQSLGATLVMRGLINESFQGTLLKQKDLKISYDINPPLFDDYGVEVVPTIIQEDAKSIKRLQGHISLKSALEIFEQR